MHEAERDEFHSKFALRLCSHWRQAAAARNPHAYLTTMARNALRDARREESRHVRIPRAILTARMSGARV